MKKVALYTLGCKVNQYETEAVSRIFEMGGYEIIDFKQVADIYVINTCTVTGLSDRKSRQVIRRARQQNPYALIIVMGCYAQTAPDEVIGIPEVNLVIGTKDRGKILEYIEELKSSKDKVNVVSDIMINQIYEEMKVEGYRENTRAFIKIEEGCSQFCTYCIIPYARGPVRSRQVEHVMEEVIRLSRSGFKEVVLTGIHLASYGMDLIDTNQVPLVKVLQKINEVKGVERIRLGSLEPSSITEKFADEMIKLSKVCEHYHISLQSGCDATLKKMNRKYTTGEYLKSIRLLQDRFPNVAVTTDIMVGFPGETDEDFKESYEFAKKIGFSKIHVFKYSQRKGTPASKFKDQVSSQEKENRSKRMTTLSDEGQIGFSEKFIGKVFPVLFEQKVQSCDGSIAGLTPNYLKIRCIGDEKLVGSIRNVQLVKPFLLESEGKIVEL